MGPTIDWTNDEVRTAGARPSSRAVFDKVEALRTAGIKLFLNLGRFEPRGYKNSSRFFDVLAGVKREGHDVFGLILADAADVDVPDGLRDSVLCVGKPTDTEMLAIMRQVDLGVSVSLWEGFNLPIVEMQNIGKPVLAFNLAAHPEVIAHPWLLCTDQDDMIMRAGILLGPQTHASHIVSDAIRKFARRLPWSDTFKKWLEAIIAVTNETPIGSVQQKRRLLTVDISLNSVLDPANSGVVRVARQLTRRLQDDGRFDLIFARWDHRLHAYVPVPGKTHLSDYGGPTDLLGQLSTAVLAQYALDMLHFGRDPRCAEPPIALLPEVTLDGSINERVGFLRYRGYLISTILYDLIPNYYPEYCNAEVGVQRVQRLQ